MRKLTSASPRPWLPSVLVAIVLASVCVAADVRVVGVTPGRSADVVIGGGDPVTIEVGETFQGVKLLRADRDRAVVSVNGTTRTLSIVADRGSGEASSSGGTTVVLAADSRGQFFTNGFVNGQSVPFVVDTGATTIALSAGMADRIGLAYEQGRRTRTSTANGVADGWQVTLDSVRVGSLTVHDLDAVVVNNDAMPVVLLGMNFLSQFDMLRQGSTLVLRRRR
jgi:aspartyl protease family protein